MTDDLSTGGRVAHREAAEEAVRHRQPGVCARHLGRLLEAGLLGVGGAQGDRVHDQEGRVAAQDAAEGAVPDQVVVFKSRYFLTELHFVLLLSDENKDVSYFIVMSPVH